MLIRDDDTRRSYVLCLVRNPRTGDENGLLDIPTALSLYRMRPFQECPYNCSSLVRVQLCFDRCCFRSFVSLASPSLFAPSPNDVTTARSYRVALPRNRPTDLTVRKVESSRETLNRNTENEGKGRALARSLARSFLRLPFPSFPFPLVILSSSLPPSIPRSLARSPLFTAIFPFEGRRVQLPSRSCYHCD